MDLWIRSQDKINLVKITELWNCNVVIQTDIDGYTANIGEYETRERAQEVLDDIQLFIEQGCKRYDSNGHYRSTVYEMPEN